MSRAIEIIYTPFGGYGDTLWSVDMRCPESLWQGDEYLSLVKIVRSQFAALNPTYVRPSTSITHQVSVWRYIIEPFVETEQAEWVTP